MDPVPRHLQNLAFVDIRLLKPGRLPIDGDHQTGVETIPATPLTSAAVPHWARLSLLEERRSRAKQALGALGTGGTRDPREEMRLHAALGQSTAEAPEIGAAFTKALDITESHGDTE